MSTDLKVRSPAKGASGSVASTASSLPILGKGLLERVVKARRHAPVFIVDLAVPRDVEPEVGQLDDHLKNAGPYMCGDTFTLADIPVGLVVNRWFSLTFEKPSYEAVAAYYDRLGERPAYRRHVRNGLP